MICHISVYVLKGPRVCNTPKQRAPPSKRHCGDQRALQTGQGQSCGEVQIRFGLKKISHGAPLNPLWKILKEYGTRTNLPSEGRPSTLTDQARRALIREATKRPKMTLKELQSSTVEIGESVHRTTLSRTLHRAGLYGWPEKSHCLKKKGMWETPQTYGRWYSG